MPTQIQWALFEASAIILGAVAWQNFWAMLLGPSIGADLMSLAGWVAAFVVQAWRWDEY
jgi:hypothetical protein